MRPAPPPGRPLAAPLGLALALATPAALAEGLPLAIEAGAALTGARSNALNPGGAVLDLPEQTGLLALRLSPNWRHGDLSLQGDLWGTGRVAEGEGSEVEGHVYRLVAEATAAPGVLLSVGAQVPHWGPGYVWNPANPFTDPSVNNLDRAFTYHRDGDLFMAAEWAGAEQGLTLYLTEWRPYDLLYGDLPNPEAEPSAALRWQRLFSSSDLTLVAASRGGEVFASLAASATVGEALELHAEAAFTGERRTLLPVAEAVPLPAGESTIDRLAATDAGDGATQLLIGGQYTFTNLTNVIIEYFYNGEGYSDAEWDRLETAVAAAGAGLADPVLGAARGGFLGEVAGITGRMRRNYLFGRVAFTGIGELGLDLRLYWRYGLDDHGQVQGGYARLPLGQGAELRASAEHYAGPPGSETRLIPLDWSASLAIAVQF